MVTLVGTPDGAGAGGQRGGRAPCGHRRRPLRRSPVLAPRQPFGPQRHARARPRVAAVDRLDGGRHRAVRPGRPPAQLQSGVPRAVSGDRRPDGAGGAVRGSHGRLLPARARGSDRWPHARAVPGRRQPAAQRQRDHRNGPAHRRPLAADDRLPHGRGRNHQFPPRRDRAEADRARTVESSPADGRPGRTDLRLVLAPGRGRTLHRVLQHDGAIRRCWSGETDGQTAHGHARIRGRPRRLRRVLRARGTARAVPVVHLQDAWRGWYARCGSR